MICQICNENKAFDKPVDSECMGEDPSCCPCYIYGSLRNWGITVPDRHAIYFCRECLPIIREAQFADSYFGDRPCPVK